MTALYTLTIGEQKPEPPKKEEKEFRFVLRRESDAHHITGNAPTIEQLLQQITSALTQ